MKVLSVKLKDFRCFENFEIYFDSQYNTHVILAENMAGKSALMRALRLAVGYYISGVSSPRQKIEIDDHRIIGNNPIADVTLGTSVEVSAELGKKTDASWVRYREKPKGRTQTKIIGNSVDPSFVARDIYKSVVLDRNTSQLLPLFSFVGTEYMYNKSSDTEDLSPKGDATQGYRYCLENKSIEKFLFNWLGRIDGIIGEKGRKKIVEEAYGSLPEAAMEIFQYAVKSLLPDVEDVEWLQDQKQPIIKFSNGEVRLFDMLSDGYRYLVLLAGELATRAFILNKNYSGDLLKDIKGVVLIDEFGIHLHPSLQNDTLRRLQEIFPNVQFILSTHSPLLINGLKKEQIHILEVDRNGIRTVRHPDDDAIGLGAEGILRNIFGLETTYDRTSLDWTEEYRVLFNKKQNGGLSPVESRRFSELSEKLAPLRLDPSLNIIQEDDSITRLVKEKLAQKEEQVGLEKVQLPDNLSEQIDGILNDLFSTNA